ncbi:MAG: tyrosine-type recombinase/integrase [Lachnospiraceae bacterium]|nr:tyrosine-type recombinase/integrase [Lachnospiraceae bacterium]
MASNSNKTYHDQVTIQNMVKLRELLKELPAFVADYFRGIEFTTESRTRLSYAIDLKTFFSYIQENNPIYKNMPMHQFPISILEQITSYDIEEYLSYIRYYEKDGKTYTNNDRAIKRKLSSIRSFYRYFHQTKRIDVNPSEQVLIPKIHEKNIVRLEINEVSELLDHVESGEQLSKLQQVYHEKLKTRDMAILTLLLGTGIRVSECVGLDLTDVDFENQCIKVIRKGGYEDIVYFGDEVRDALADYFEERGTLTPNEGHEQALFLSRQNRRITVRSVEILVKKYATTVTTLKKITPHKLRSTYGTNLYQETGDIYLVADVLGHKDVNTTRKHYADVLDETKRRAKDAVRLRTEQDSKE